MNHKWDKDNVCVNCGIVRIKRSWKLLMAITDQPPYDHYKYGRSWYYGQPKGEIAVQGIGFKRPDCKTITNHTP